MAEVDVPNMFGALLIGGIIAILFSGVTQTQTFLYFRMYHSDSIWVKLLVMFTWLLDTLHTVFIGQSLWNYLIQFFGQAEKIDVIPIALSLTIAVTAVLTFAVQMFFIYRIYILSSRNLFIAVPLSLIAAVRLAFACLTTAKLIELRSLEGFVDEYAWSFTAGLSISAILDVLITGCMCWFLRTRKREFSNLNDVLDSLILYAFENGVLTTVAAVLSLVTWITMPHNLVFMAAHFVIIKFYANSLLATFNARAIARGNISPVAVMQASGSGGPISGFNQDMQLASRHPHGGARHTVAYPSAVHGTDSFALTPTRKRDYAGSTDSSKPDDVYDGSARRSGDLGSPGNLALRINVATTTLCVADELDAHGRVLGGKAV